MSDNESKLPVEILADGYVTCEYELSHQGKFIITNYSAKPQRVGHGTRGLQELRESRRVSKCPDVEIKTILAVSCTEGSIDWWVKMGHKGLIDYAFDFGGRQIWPPPQ